MRLDRVLQRIALVDPDADASRRDVANTSASA